MAIPPDAITELNDKCGLPFEDCRVLLEQHGGHVDVALAALIEAGRVKVDDLNPDTVSDELFTLAAHHKLLQFYRDLEKGDRGWAEQWGMTRGTTPEEMTARREAERAEHIEKRRLAGSFYITPAMQERISVQNRRRSAWLEAHPTTLRLPPFPPLTMELSDWVGKDVLPTWAGTQERQGGYNSLSGDAPSDGSCPLKIPRRCMNDAKPMPPAPEQVAAYRFLKEREPEITESVLAAILQCYAELRPLWLEQLPDADDLLPDLKSVDELKRHVGLGTLHMFEVAKDGSAYFGLELGCTWDDDHGAGVVLHQGRVVAIGQADISFNRHVAVDDGGVKLPNG